mmetsp:Transcript_26442/g.62120  ORF Transcript_26442/g.62120 Transcript_26442/m.62120 type:complete len:282 (-) Transcript_26442:31-876(-)
MLPTMREPGSSVANTPIDDRRMQWALFSSIALIMARKVKVLMRLRMVKMADSMMNRPAQKLAVPQLAATRSSRTALQTLDELKRTPHCVDSRSDMKTMLLAYRSPTYVRRIFPSSMAQVLCLRQIEKWLTGTRYSRNLSNGREAIQVLPVKSRRSVHEEVRCLRPSGFLSIVGPRVLLTFERTLATLMSRIRTVLPPATGCCCFMVRCVVSRSIEPVCCVAVVWCCSSGPYVSDSRVRVLVLFAKTSTAAAGALVAVSGAPRSFGELRLLPRPPRPSPLVR